MTTTLTHRRKTGALTKSHVILFCDNERNDHYGDHVWELRSELPVVSAKVVAYACNFFGVSEEEARALVNPSNIVGTAGAWDDTQFVSEVYQFCGEPAGFRLPDGAVVLDREAVEIIKVA